VKVTVVLRVYRNSKYDGTCVRAEFKDVLGPDGQSLPDDHPFLEACRDELYGDGLFVHTDNPCVYGEPDRQHELFGAVIDNEDLEVGGDSNVGPYKSEHNCDVWYYGLEFELDDQNRVVPHGELVLSRLEVDHVNHVGTMVLVAYFLGTPGPTQLEAVWDDHCDHRTSFAPHQTQDAVADRAGLQRWVLG
jgi:hypothetical protein